VSGNLLGNVESAIVDFYRAKRLMEEELLVTAASQVVERANRGEVARHGRGQGFVYSIHGIGYTVVLPSGAPAHIDSLGDEDGFTSYDIRAYLDEVLETVPSIEEIRLACDLCAAQGLIVKVDAATYRFVREK